MDMERSFRGRTASRRSQPFSRRQMLVSGTFAGVAGVVGASAVANRVSAAPLEDKRNDITILNNALYYEHQAIWAYDFAATKLTNTSIGQAVLAVALANQADHKRHRDTLAKVVGSLGGTPVTAAKSYDVSSYLKAGEGGIDSDVNIAKLALALETDAAIAYTREIAKLKTPALITAGASIGSDEAAHAAAIRAAFNALGVKLPVVPASFVSEETREAWILRV